MSVCDVCGRTADLDVLISIGFIQGKIKVILEDENVKSIFRICADKDCIIQARSGDLISKAIGRTLGADIYLEIAKAATGASERSTASLIGMAQKSGSLVTGTEGVIQKLRRGAVYLVLVDPDMSVHTMKKIQTATHSFKCPLRNWTGQKSIETLLNKPNCKVIGFLNRDFARILINSLETHGK